MDLSGRRETKNVTDLRAETGRRSRNQKRIGEYLWRKGRSYDPEDAYDRAAERVEKSYNKKHGKDWWDGAWAMRSESLGQLHDEQKEDAAAKDTSDVDGKTERQRRIGEHIMKRNEGKTPEEMWNKKAADMSGDYAHNGEWWKYAKEVSAMKEDLARDEKYGKNDSPKFDTEQKSDNTATKDIAPKETPDMDDKAKSDAIVASDANNTGWRKQEPDKEGELKGLSWENLKKGDNAMTLYTKEQMPEHMEEGVPIQNQIDGMRWVKEGEIKDADKQSRMPVDEYGGQEVDRDNIKKTGKWRSVLGMN